MPVKEIQAYYALIRQGPGTVAKRLAILEAQKAKVEADIQEKYTEIAHIDHKISQYQAGLKGYL